MSDPIDETRRTHDRIPPSVARAVEAMRHDVVWMHRAWMEVVFPRGLEADYSVIESVGPGTTRGAVVHRLWSAVGALFLAVAYPLYVFGLATRYYGRRIDRLSAALGFAGVALVSLLVWGALSAATYLSPIAFEGFVAVVVAGLVATISAVLALFFRRLDGRLSTVAFAYPFGVTAIFLPPVMAALYSPTLASFVFPHSYSLAVWLLDNVLSVGGVAAFIRASFELEGLAYVGMWFGLAIPTGWLLGALVALANAVRPSGGPDTVEDVEPGFVYR